jgi:glycine betaine/choline ABC-type transport system substrate-binding protein
MNELSTEEKTMILQWALALSNALRRAGVEMCPVSSLDGFMQLERLKLMRDDDPLMPPLLCATTRTVQLTEALTNSLDALRELLNVLADDAAVVVLYQSQVAAEAPGEELPGVM